MAGSSRELLSPSRVNARTGAWARRSCAIFCFLRESLLVTCCLLACLADSARGRAAEEKGEGSFCANGLRQAVNAAIVELAGENYVGSTLLPQFPTVPYVPVLACPSPAAGDALPAVVQPPKPSTVVIGEAGRPVRAETAPTPPTPEVLARDRASLWPAPTSLHESDLLLDVLETGTLRVAGLGPRSPDPRKGSAFLSEVDPLQADRGFNWGQEGDYSVSPPVGYFPTYLQAIATKIGNHYKRRVVPEYLFFVRGEDAMKSVAQGTAHMTDIYFIQAYQQGSTSHLPEFYRTCPVSGSPNNLLTLKEYRINSLQSLVRTLRMATNPGMRTLAYLSSGNYETVHFFFPRQALGEVMTQEEAERRIAAKEILGNIRTGSAGMLPDTFEVVDLGLVLVQGPWIKRTDTPHCLYHQLLVRQDAKKHYSSSEGGAKDAEAKGAQAAAAGGLGAQASRSLAASAAASSLAVAALVSLL
ncbi:hypothetical protein BESB_084790 [Besnoitia besnoiti]|uniref:Uncharacterized protein n=1 Tax=Besnoitia besnoiti TaxID=94643 RepID=A0A2A9MD16_BESBE|nr:hypothetical protein BESB_084790 [Besnoitia besnoiti]PFH33280.1 hypothetical protein BESB_084790 [Besnoitia besnoiti]